jgi:hypothetical protein
MPDTRVSGRIKLKTILKGKRIMEAKESKAIIGVLIIIAAIAALVVAPLLKGVVESVSVRARNDAIFAFGIITLIAVLIFGCVAVIAHNLRR